MKTPRHHVLPIILMLCTVLSASTKVRAQDSQQMVRQVVDRLFNGMRAGDSAMVRSVFTDGATLHSISNNEKDSLIIHSSPISAFINAVGTPHTKQWDEQIYDVKILVDAPMATVWAPYKFNLGGTFSHCGVNVFTLLFSKGSWKISAITDTRRKEKCP